MRTINPTVVKKREQKNLMGPMNAVEIVLYHPIKSYSIRNVLEALELKDLKIIAKQVDVKIGRNKKEIVQNLWMSGKIEKLGIITG